MNENTGKTSGANDYLEKGRKTSESRDTGRKLYNKRNGKGFKKRGDSKPVSQGGRHDYIPAAKSHNDVSWYTVSEQINKDVGSIPFNIFTGAKLPEVDWDKVNSTNHDDYTGRSYPGVMVLKYVPTIGTSVDATSAVNVAGRAIYSYVRHQNSGHTNYEQVDLLEYILAMDSVYLLIHEAKRIYRIAMTYEVANRYTPDAILDALGVDANNIRTNLAQFRYGINIRISKIRALCVPQAFDLFKRRALLATVVLTDSTSKKSQYYAYESDGYYQFTPTAQGGGTLNYIQHKTSAKRTSYDILHEIDTALDVLLQDEDINIMSGDILKAYGQDSCYDLPYLNDAEMQDFIYDEIMLNQLENSMCMNALKNSDLNITQAGGYLVFKPVTNVATLDVPTFYRALAPRYILNSHKDACDYSDVIEFTRNMFTVDDERVIHCASELIRSIGVSHYDYTTGGTTKPVLDGWGFSTVTIVDLPKVGVALTQEANDSVSNTLAMLAEKSKFDWCPFTHLFLRVNVSSEPSPSADNIIYMGAVGDIKNSTIISVDAINRLNEMCIMGLFKTQLLK